MRRRLLVRALLPAVGILGVVFAYVETVETPTAVLAHSIVGPRLIRLEVKSQPSQLVKTRWTLECERRNGTTSLTKKTFTDSTPLQADVPLPVRNPERCDISASASFVDGDGRLEVVLLKQ